MNLASNLAQCVPCRCLLGALLASIVGFGWNSVAAQSGSFPQTGSTDPQSISFGLPGHNAPSGDAPHQLPKEPRRLPRMRPEPESVASPSNTGPRLLQAGFESNLSRPLSDSKNNGASGIWKSLLTVGGALSVVLGLFLGFVAIGNRARRPATNLPNGVVQSLGQLAITPRLEGHVIRFGNRILLLAVTGNSTFRVAEISEPDEVNQILRNCSAGTGSPTRVDEALQRYEPNRGRYGANQHRRREPLV